MTHPRPTHRTTGIAGTARPTRSETDPAAQPRSSRIANELDDAHAEAALRSREAEAVVQAAYGSRGAARQDGLMETLVTVFATIVFGLGWASIESGSLAELPVETRYAASDSMISSTSSTPSTSSTSSTSSGAAYRAGAPGARHNAWTEKPLARSK